MDPVSPIRAIANRRPEAAASTASTTIGIATIDGDGVVVGCNDALQRMVRAPGGSIVGTHFSELLSGGSAPGRRALHADLRGGTLDAFQIDDWYVDPEGDRQWARMTVAMGQAASGRPPGATLLLENITHRRRTAQRLAAQQAVAPILAEAADLAEASPKILRAICDSLEWDVGSLWIVNRDKGLLQFVEAWAPQNISTPRFLEMSMTMRVTPGVGLPGLAWERRVPIWIDDLTNAGPVFVRGRVAAEEGLHAAIAFPIMLGSEVVGVMDFCSRDIRRRDEEVLRILSTFGSQIGQFMERKRVELALRANERQLQALIDNTAALIYVTAAPNGTVILANRTMEELFASNGGVRGRCISEVFAPPVAARIAEETARAMAGGLVECEEILASTRGARTYVSQRFPLRDEDGAPYAVASVSTDITERKQDEDDLHTLATQLSTAEDDARRRLARDIHDSIGQTLSLLKIDLERAAASPDDAATRCAAAVRLLDNVIAETRTLIFDLYPAMLDDLGLVPTLQSHVDQFAARHGLSISLSESGVRARLTSAASAYVFRAVKELLNNIVKHAHASSALVALHWKPDTLRISVTDDGRGFVPDAALTPLLRRGLGLADIRERVRALGGALVIESSPKEGTRVVLDIPVVEEKS